MPLNKETKPYLTPQRTFPFFMDDLHIYTPLSDLLTRWQSFILFKTKHLEFNDKFTEWWKQSYLRAVQKFFKVLQKYSVTTVIYLIYLNY